MEERNYLVLAQYREGSEYDDRIGHLYHFPRKYLNQMSMPGAEFIYFEPKKSGRGEYFGYGKIGRVYGDEQNKDQFFAEILDFLPFPSPVFGFDEYGKSREFGPFYNPQNAVRKTSSDIFLTICAEGGVDLTSLGTEAEDSESDEPITDPFEPSKIKVDREPMSVFQVLRKLSLDEIQLNPDFQRNLVWDPVRKSRLIESLLLRIPLPAFYFDGIDANKWAVVDGLQRLSTIQDFVTNKNFALQGLEYLAAAEGLRFDQLPRGMQRDIEETQVMLFIIRPDTPADVKFTIFYRINTGGLVLMPQEIRHALFQGQATTLLRDLSSSPDFLAATDGGVSDIRMDARECILRYLAFRMNPYTSYNKSDLNSFLSTTMRNLNQISRSELDRLAEDFREAMARAYTVFGRFAFRKFTYGGRRGPVNKALFESWSNVLQKFDLQHLIKHREEILRRVSEMFASDADYSRSLSAGTGSLRSVSTRFERAERSLEEILK